MKKQQAQKGQLAAQVPTISVRNLSNQRQVPRKFRFLKLCALANVMSLKLACVTSRQKPASTWHHISFFFFLISFFILCSSWKSWNHRVGLLPASILVWEQSRTQAFEWPVTETQPVLQIFSTPLSQRALRLMRRPPMSVTQEPDTGPSKPPCFPLSEQLPAPIRWGLFCFIAEWETLLDSILGFVVEKPPKEVA